MKLAERPAQTPSVPQIHRALCRGIEEGVFPGGATAVFLSGKLIHLSSAGQAQRVPSTVAMTDEALFDLASVTKIAATTSALAVLLGRGQLSLEDPISRFWPGFGRAGKQPVTVRHLLSHSSGLPAWKPFFLEVARDAEAAPLFACDKPNLEVLGQAAQRGKAMVLAAIEETPLERAPGEAAVYSDLGFIALGRLVELLSGTPLEDFVARKVFAKMALPALGYRPLWKPASADALIATTGVCRPREPAPGQEGIVPAPDPTRPPEARPGEVDDDNAFAMGGVAGHAGLFGTARDLAAFGSAVLEELRGAQRLAPEAVWRALCTRDATPGTTRALGFDTPSEKDSSAGRYLAASRSVGHLGFTGTSLWLDLERQLAIALLTNRVHPSRANVAIKPFRPAFHDAVVEALQLQH